VTFLLINNFDLWIVGSYLPESDVAIYGAAIRLVLFISTPLLIINSVVPPIIGELYARGSQATLQRILQASAAAAVLPAVAVFLIYLLAPEWSLGIAFGAAYRTQSAVSVLLVLGAGKLISVYFGSCGNTLIMTGHERLMMKIAILGGAFTVIAGLALIETFGILGAAIASSSGLIFQNIMMWIGANRKTGIKTHASFLLLPEFIHAAKQSLGSKEK
jgi:O-antigen/teichoic acid export membrane protein